MSTKQKKIGLLGDKPVLQSTPVMLGYPDTIKQRKMRYNHIPHFISREPILNISNRYSYNIDYKKVRQTLIEYTTASRNTRDIVNKILFSCFHTMLFSILGNLTLHLQKDVSKSYIPLLVGGMAIRYYNQSHMSHDMDIKIYPDELESSRYNPNIVLKHKIRPLLETIVNKITSQYNTVEILKGYIDTFLKPNSDIRNIKEVIEYFEKHMRRGISWNVNHPYVFNIEKQKMTEIKDLSKLKIICSFTDDPSIVYKLMDVSMYDPTDETYNALIKTYYDSSKSDIEKTHTSYIPPFILVHHMDNLPTYIVSEQFMKFEKDFLLEKYKDNDFFRNKFIRAKDGLEVSPEIKKNYRFLGGKRRRSTKKRRYKGARLHKKTKRNNKSKRNDKYKKHNKHNKTKRVKQRK